MTRERSNWTFSMLTVSVVMTTLVAPSPPVAAQSPRPFFVWEKVSSCQDTRQDWFTVAQEYPGAGTGTPNAWQQAGSFPTFAAAMAAADTMKMAPFLQFKSRCCNDWAVYEDTRTGRQSVMRSSGIFSVPQGQVLLRSDMCCEEAFAAAGVPVGATSDCRNLQLSTGQTVTVLNGKFVPAAVAIASTRPTGNTRPGGNSGTRGCFGNDAGAASTNRADHLNWARRQNSGAIQENLVDKLDMLFQCDGFSAADAARAYADLSVAIVQNVKNAACFDNDPDQMSPDWNRHHQLVQHLDRLDILDALELKFEFAFKCLDREGQASLFADASVAAANIPLGQSGPRTAPIPQQPDRGVPPEERVTPPRTTRPGPAETTQTPPPGVRSCDAAEAAAFSRLTGTWRSRGPIVTISGSCEQVSGTYVVAEYCESPEATYNKTLPRYRGTFTGRTVGASIQVDWMLPGGSVHPDTKGTAACRLDPDGTLSCSGFGCGVSGAKR
jgi:hypothetical protein